MPSHKIGVDVGGTKIEGIVLDKENNEVLRKRVATPKENYDKIILEISKLVKELHNVYDDATVGVCTPGTISNRTGVIKNSNTTCLIGKQIKQDIESGIGKKILLENDANCFAVAEAKFGAAKNYSVVFGVIMGTGVGGGIVIDGNLHKGRTNIAGEWGHHKLHHGGNSCYCGMKGCVETYISGPALEKRWYELSGRKERLEDISQAANGDLWNKWKEEFLENFAIGIANVIDILDPDVVVLGGGVSNVSFLYDEGKERVYKKVFSDHVDTPIIQNRLGDSAGVIGAALL